jgi:hypothetical protein
LDHWKPLKPLLGVIVADDRALPHFSGAQPPFLNFLIGDCSTDAVTSAKLVNAHRPLPAALCSLLGTTPPLALCHFRRFR